MKLTDVLDADPGHSADLQAAKNFTLGDDESVSTLSDIESDEFEDVPPAGKSTSQQKDKKEEEHDEEIDWEDAMAAPPQVRQRHLPMEGGNLELNLSRNVDELEEYDLVRAATISKKGPTKIEREIRVQTHCMHVQFLLYHNAIRNCWACDKEVQDTLIKQLPTGITKEIRKWRAACGLEPEQMRLSKNAISSSQGKRNAKKLPADNGRNQRDWGRPSTRLENGTPDLSRGDPIIPLLKILAAYWKKRFTVMAPGLRKTGYAPAAVRQRQIRSFQNDKHDPEKHGERVGSLTEFRRLASRCQGSRDVGAQLFTALLRAIGIESRLVASLQPSGFGWTKNEQADVKRPGKGKEEESEASSTDVSKDGNEPVPKKQKTSNDASRRGATRNKNGARKAKGKGLSNDPVDLDASSPDESILSDSHAASTNGAGPATTARKSSKYDRDLPFPIYWTEVVSPINSTVIPVSPLVLPNPVASTPEILSTFEPRGAKAEKARLVMAYVIAYSFDGSAKDVTTRYLKRRMWPGKTKGFRMPVEKVPIYNKRGKILRYEEYDWFKSVMSGYVRTEKMRSAVDDVEESTDLVPQQPERKENQQEGDTLQSLKSSAEFVLERFLRREEALKADAKPVRTFATGKGDKLKEENVYQRADVERCLSAESWHKEGRQIKEGEAPLKLVPIRAVTLTRKREVEEMQRQTGEKPTQGLYSREQTEYIIPPPIEDGVIPKNSYGNIDCFVPSMVPRGAVHIPMRGTVRICKKLEINYAEAVTGFEFGHKLAVPVVEGVVIAEEHEEAVREAWGEYAEQQRIKEEGKLEKAVLNLWKRMLMGLRIRERVSDTYGEDADPGVEVIDLESGPGRLNDVLPPHDDHSRDDASLDTMQDGGGFLLPHEDDEDQAAASTELVVVHDGIVPERKQKELVQYPTPVSMASTKIKKAGRHRGSLIDSEETPELSEVGSATDDHDTEDGHLDFKQGKSSKAYSEDMRQKAQLSLETPKKRRPVGNKLSQATGQTSATKDANGPFTRSDSENNDRTESQRPSKLTSTKRMPGRPRKSSSAVVSPPKRKQQPRRASRKAALTSPYFDSHSDDGSDG
jgi:xeroderma pigmentosum group C-complementing protein